MVARCLLLFALLAFPAAALESSDVPAELKASPVPANCASQLLVNPSFEEGFLPVSKLVGPELSFNVRTRADGSASFRRVRLTQPAAPSHTTSLHPFPRRPTTV